MQVHKEFYQEVRCLRATDGAKDAVINSGHNCALSAGCAYPNEHRMGVQSSLLFYETSPRSASRFMRTEVTEVFDRLASVAPGRARGAHSKDSSITQTYLGFYLRLCRATVGPCFYFGTHRIITARLNDRKAYRDDEWTVADSKRNLPSYLERQLSRLYSVFEFLCRSLTLHQVHVDGDTISLFKVIPSSTRKVKSKRVSTCRALVSDAAPTLCTHTPSAEPHLKEANTLYRYIAVWVCRFCSMPYGCGTPKRGAYARPLGESVGWVRNLRLGGSSSQPYPCSSSTGWAGLVHTNARARFDRTELPVQLDRTRTFVAERHSYRTGGVRWARGFSTSVSGLSTPTNQTTQARACERGVRAKVGPNTRMGNPRRKVTVEAKAIQPNMGINLGAAPQKVDKWHATPGESAEGTVLTPRAAAAQSAQLNGDQRWHLVVRVQLTAFLGLALLHTGGRMYEDQITHPVNWMSTTLCNYRFPQDDNRILCSAVQRTCASPGSLVGSPLVYTKPQVSASTYTLGERAAALSYGQGRPSFPKDALCETSSKDGQLHPRLSQVTPSSEEGCALHSDRLGGELEEPSSQVDIRYGEPRAMNVGLTVLFSALLRLQLWNLVLLSGSVTYGDAPLVTRTLHRNNSAVTYGVDTVDACDPRHASLLLGSTIQDVRITGAPQCWRQDTAAGRDTSSCSVALDDRLVRAVKRRKLSSSAMTGLRRQLVQDQARYSLISRPSSGCTLPILVTAGFAQFSVASDLPTKVGVTQCKPRDAQQPNGCQHQQQELNSSFEAPQDPFVIGNSRSDVLRIATSELIASASPSEVHTLTNNCRVVAPIAPVNYFTWVAVNLFMIFGRYTTGSTGALSTSAGVEYLSLDGVTGYIGDAEQQIPQGQHSTTCAADANLTERTSRSVISRLDSTQISYGTRHLARTVYAPELAARRKTLDNVRSRNLVGNIVGEPALESDHLHTHPQRCLRTDLFPSARVLRSQVQSSTKEGCGVVQLLSSIPVSAPNEGAHPDTAYLTSSKLDVYSGRRGTTERPECTPHTKFTYVHDVNVRPSETSGQRLRLPSMCNVVPNAVRFGSSATGQSKVGEAGSSAQSCSAISLVLERTRRRLPFMSHIFGCTTHTTSAEPHLKEANTWYNPVSMNAVQAITGSNSLKHLGCFRRPTGQIQPLYAAKLWLAAWRRYFPQVMLFVIRKKPNKNVFFSVHNGLGRLILKSSAGCSFGRRKKSRQHSQPWVMSWLAQRVVSDARGVLTPSQRFRVPDRATPAQSSVFQLHNLHVNSALDHMLPTSSTVSLCVPNSLSSDGLNDPGHSAHLLYTPALRNSTPLMLGGVDGSVLGFSATAIHTSSPSDRCTTPNDLSQSSTSQSETEGQSTEYRGHARELAHYSRNAIAATAQCKARLLRFADTSGSESVHNFFETTHTTSANTLYTGGRDLRSGDRDRLDVRSKIVCAYMIDVAHAILPDYSQLKHILRLAFNERRATYRVQSLSTVRSSTSATISGQLPKASRASKKRASDKAADRSRITTALESNRTHGTYASRSYVRIIYQGGHAPNMSLLSSQLLRILRSTTKLQRLGREIRDTWSTDREQTGTVSSVDARVIGGIPFVDTSFSSVTDHNVNVAGNGRLPSPSSTLMVNTRRGRGSKDGRTSVYMSLLVSDQVTLTPKLPYNSQQFKRPPSR